MTGVCEVVSKGRSLQLQGSIHCLRENPFSGSGLATKMVENSAWAFPGHFPLYGSERRDWKTFT